MGKGKPVDARDYICKTHKECLHCASEQYGASRGDGCLSDYVRYSYGTSNGMAYCTNDANTCERAVCECNLEFAEYHARAKDIFNENYHSPTEGTYGNFDPTDPLHCVSVPGSNAADMQCCNNADVSRSFKWFNANKYQCCPNGFIEEHGQLC